METLNLPKHINPESLSDNRRSTAPYNFVPLPDKVITAVNDPQELPNHDTYANSKYPHTGYFDVTLTTKSPFYVRGMLTRTEFDLDEHGLDRNEQKVEKGVTRITDRFKNKADFFHTGDADKPVIPGSSLRGMLRSLVEIVSYGKVSRVSDKKLIYRAVGDTTALGAWYREQTLGANQDTYPNMQFDYPSSQLKGGYLCKHQGQWAIRPAVEHLGESFVHVEYFAVNTIIGGQNRQIYHDIYVKPVSRTTSNRGRRGPGNLALNVAVTTIAAPNGGSKPAGMQRATLVESGNAPRKHMHCAIYEPNNSVTPILIPIEMWHDYEEDRELTRGIKTRKIENSGDPLFYLTDSSGNLVFFGPTMMFRLRYNNSVWSMIPDELRLPVTVDFADALFGFVREKKDFKDKQSLPYQGDKKRAYASRVQVSDAKLNEEYAPDKLWLTANERLALAPHILSTPKPTSFQHYLVQEEAGKPELSHYDSPTEDAEGTPKGHRTFIRGAKRYWPQGDKPLVDLRAQTPMAELQISSQHTLIKPVRSDVQFTFRVYFENLSNEELGALCWVLHPLGDKQKYCHQLGMGKPLGMGAVKLDATLHLNNRKKRYESIFSETSWATGYDKSGLRLSERGDEIKTFTDAFEAKILGELKPFKDGKECSRLADLKRIAMLLKMMEWENGLSADDVQTQGLQTGFKDRRVLPDPSHWIPKPERDKLVEPMPPQNSAGSMARSDSSSGAKSSGLAKNTPSGMGNTLNIQTETAAAATPKAQSGKEQVTLISKIKAGGKAQVKIGNEQITCEKMPTTPFNAPQPGDLIWANITRDKDGKAISAKYLLEG